MAKAKVDTVLKKVGAGLKALRVQAGYTSYETFAVEHDLSRRYYWGAEKGRNLTIKYLVEILNIHQITIEEFFASLDEDK